MGDPYADLPDTDPYAALPGTDPYAALPDVAPMGAGRAFVEGVIGAGKSTLANLAAAYKAAGSPSPTTWGLPAPNPELAKPVDQRVREAREMFSPLATEGAEQTAAAVAAHPIIGQTGAFVGMLPGYAAPPTILMSELGAATLSPEGPTGKNVAKALGKTALFSALPLAHSAAAPVLRSAEAAIAAPILKQTGNLVAAKVGAKLVVGVGEAAAGQEAILGGIAAIDQDAAMYDPTNPEAYTTRAAGLLLGGSMLAAKGVIPAAREAIKEAKTDAAYKADAATSRREVAEHAARMAEQQPVNTVPFREEVQGEYAGTDVWKRVTPTDRAEAANAAVFGTSTRDLFTPARRIEIDTPTGDVMLRPARTAVDPVSEVRTPVGEGMTEPVGFRPAVPEARTPVGEGMTEPVGFRPAVPEARTPVGEGMTEPVGFRPAVPEARTPVGEGMTEPVGFRPAVPEARTPVGETMTTGAGRLPAPDIRTPKGRVKAEAVRSVPTYIPGRSPEGSHTSKAKQIVVDVNIARASPTLADFVAVREQATRKALASGMGEASARAEGTKAAYEFAEGQKLDPETAEARIAGILQKRYPKKFTTETPGGRPVAPTLEAAATRMTGGGAKLSTPDASTLRVTTSNGHTLDIVLDTDGTLPAGMLGGVRTEVVDGKARSTIHLHPEATRGTLGHEIGHINVDHFMTPKEVAVLLSRITEADVTRTLAKYEAAGHPVSREQARLEAGLDRLRDYENHGVLERSVWQRMADFAREVARHFGLGVGSERRIMDQMLGGKFFERGAREAESRPSYSAADTGAKEGEKRTLRQKVASALRDNPLMEPIQRMQERAETATGKRKAAAEEAVSMQKAADQLAQTRRALGQEVVIEATKMNATAASADLAETIKSTAPVGHDVGVNSEVYDALYGGKKATSPVAKKAVGVIEQATRQTNQWLREAGIDASGRTPRVNGRDYRAVMRDGDARNAYLAKVAELNGLPFEEVQTHFAGEAFNKADSAIQLAPAELSRKFENMPQFFDYQGTRYEMFSVSPEQVVRGIIEDSAHRSAFAQVFGTGYNVQAKEAAPLGMKRWNDLSPSDQAVMHTWAELFHGATLGPRLDMDGAWNWVRATGDLAGGLIAASKEKALITAAPGNLIGSLMTMSQAGVKPTLKAVRDVALSPRRTVTEAQQTGMAGLLMRTAYDPNSPTLSLVNGVRNKVGFVNRLANELSAAVAQRAANYAFDAAQESAREGKPDAVYQSMLRTLGFTRKEIVDITETGAATKQMREEVVRRTVTASTGATTTRGGAAPWANYWVTRKLGPAFTSWADAQIKRRLRLAAAIIESPSPANLRTGLTDVLAALGTGAITTSLFWGWVRGGEEGTQQDLDRGVLANLGDYFLQGYGGGYINAIGSLYTKGQGTTVGEAAKLVSYPVSAAMNEAHAVSTAVQALKNGEGMLAALGEYGKTSTPIIQRAHDAFAWSVEDRNPGTLRRATSLFHAWRTANPDLATPPFAGATSSDSDTSLAINRALRAIKQGDKMTPALAVRIGLVGAKEGKDPATLRAAILGHRIITKLPLKTRQQALAKIARDLGPVTMARLQRHDLLIEIMADIAAPKVVKY